MKERIENLQKSFDMLSYYTGTARATVDVDFIISAVDFERASQAIRQVYAQFKPHNRVYHVTHDTKKPHVKDPERIDLVKDGFPLFKSIVKKYCVALRSKEQVIKIPTIEVAIALKFAASISPHRGDENKPVDQADLLKLIRTTSKLDKKTLLALGELIYLGGGKELVATVDDVRHGKAISL